MTTAPIPRILLAAAILELTLATALIHLTLGGTLFALNAVGYLALGAAYVVSVARPSTLGARLGWLSRVGLGAYAAVTILAYLVSGPFFTLGWVTKGIELAIVLLVVLDLVAGDTGPARRRPPMGA
jgi:hypothetical protein